jgi:uncharacterized membrane protein
MIGGGTLALYGLKRRSVGGLALAALGGGLVYGGVKSMETSKEGAKIRKGRKIVKAVTVNRSPEELYGFWRNFENLPRFMSHLESVRVFDQKRSHWVAKAPAGSTVEWHAEIVNDKENELIAWQSVDPADVGHAGSVHFEQLSNGRGTRVKVVMNYQPPFGRLSVVIAKLFGEEPEQQLQEDLRHFKQILEAGVTPTIEGQPSGALSNVRRLERRSRSSDEGEL